MLTVSFTNPHPPYVVPRKYWEMYKDADLPLPHYPAGYGRKVFRFRPGLHPLVRA